MNRPSIGLNLRLKYLEEMGDSRPNVAFWEVIAENLIHHDRALEGVLKLRRDYPIALHCVGMNLAGIDPIDPVYLGQVKGLIEKLEPFLLSDHLAVQGVGGYYHHDLLPFPRNRLHLKRVIDRVERVQEILGRRLLIENLSHYVEFQGSDYSEAEFLAEVSHKSGAGLLLDLNNIEVNHRNFAIPTAPYFEAPMVEAVEAIHIAGASVVEGLMIDSHSALPSAVQRRWLKTLLARRALPICYERDNQLLPLAQTTAELLDWMAGGEMGP